MPFRRFGLLSVCLYASIAAANAQQEVGVRDVVWANVTAQGSASLNARVYYPAEKAGSNMPVVAATNGWPVVVFLHGFSLLGDNYANLGTVLAREGFIAVLSNTTQFNNLGQEYDGRALFYAVANANEAGPFVGAIDTRAIGLVGHSMGAGNVANVLANNPGYRCGLALAPVPARAGNAASVDVPVGVIAGLGDGTTPVLLNAQPFYQSLTGYRQIKVLHLLNGDCNHNNVAGLNLATAGDSEVFARVGDFGIHFLRRFLQGRSESLDMTIGPPVFAGPRFASLTHEFEAPQIWVAGPLRLGERVRLSMAGEPGLTGALAAFRQLRTPFATPAGPLHLDPASAIVGVYGVTGSLRRFDFTMVVPGDPVFVGLTFSLQAFGNGRTGGPLLGNAIDLQVVR